MGNSASVDAEERGAATLDQNINIIPSAGHEDRELSAVVAKETIPKPVSKELSNSHLSENISLLERRLSDPKVSAKPLAKLALSDLDVERAQILVAPSNTTSCNNLDLSSSNLNIKNTTKQLSQSGMVETNHDEDELEHLGPKDILFQFIPFYGQGDATTDSLVRSTLSNLSVEEIDSRETDSGNTLLLLACQCRCEDLVRIMIHKGADCNAVNSSGACCLHFACYRDSSSIVNAKLLLKNGANPDVCENTYGCSPIHYCAGLGDMDFLNLLLNHGATIDIRDLYNYTCVDYAREAGLLEVAIFLEDKINKKKTNQLLKNHRAYTSTRGATNLGPPVAPRCVYGVDWQGYLDPVSGASYYVNSKTGECLWEYDLKLRVEAEQAQVGNSAPAAIEEVVEVLNDEDLGLPKTTSFINSPHCKAGGPPMGLGSFAVKEMMTETRAKLDAQFEEEKAVFRSNLSEKDGHISKLRSEIDILLKEKEQISDERDSFKDKYEKSEQRGGSALSTVSAEVESLQLENSGLKSEVLALKSQINYEQEKLKSLEEALANVESSQGERIEIERKSAEERAQAQMERDEMHAKALSDLEVRAANDKAILKLELERINNDWNAQLKEVQDQLARLRRAKDTETNELHRELADRKAQYAQEISSALLLGENNKKLAEECQKRAEAAEEIQKSLQDELIEAKMIQQFNAQLHKDLLREQNARKKLHNEIEDMKGKIRVYVRIRPFSRSENEKGCQEAVIKDGKMSVVVYGVGGPEGKKVYDFDQVFAGKDGNTQSDIFRDTKHLCMSVVDGYNVCIFAYGQTGAGKSYTMIGGADIGDCVLPNGDFQDAAGITPRAVVELFRLLNERSAQITYTVEVQMFQLYRDNLEDLLSKTRSDGKLKITLAEHSSSGLVQVDGAETIIATSAVEVMKIFAKGGSRRTTKETNMNTESSRSHLICSVVVRLTNRRTENQSIGKLTLVDLAGSERVDKSGAEGESLKEAQSINKSLSALGDVISALTTGQQHVPYRNHPLTMLMSDSIGGNAKTLMFVNASPADYNNAESNNSLGFASRCKDITNSVAQGPGAQAAQMAALKKELAKLKKSGGGAKKSSGGLERPGSRGAVV